jgi:phosphatidylglycerophosphatase A
MTRPDVRLITVFGLGYRWPASGTWGSLPPVILAAFLCGLAWLVRDDAGAVRLLQVAYMLALVAVLVVFSAACLVQGDGAEARFGEKDPSEVVADETAGQCLPLLVLPVLHESPGRAVLALATAFVCFRVMDIVKPPPARGLQRMSSGWGILVDDLIAGVYGAIATWALLRWVF